LITLLANQAYLTTAQFYVPESQLDKYETILGFYKKLAAEVPAFSKQLKSEYIDEVNGCDYCPKKELLKVNPEKWLLRMTKGDMEDTD
jgi:predicted AlkP superfamily phosphohydrolase/phosphomutase